jgi:hypothetical protein
VQVSETCAEENATQIITHVEVTDACASDAQATVPVLEDLDQRGQRPATLIADTTYGSAENALAAQAMGTEWVSPVGGQGSGTPRRYVVDHGRLRPGWRGRGREPLPGRAHAHPTDSPRQEWTPRHAAVRALDV